MDRISRYLFPLLLILFASLTQAQQKQAAKLNIRGTVYENQSLDPMIGAAVKLYNERDSMIAGNSTGQNGQFLLPGIPPATYTLRVTYMGYKEQKFKLTLPNRSGNFKVADIMMREDATVMAEAVVEGKLPEMTVIDDTVAYNADAFKLPDGAMVEDLVKKLPGIVQDENGNFTFNGKPISQILVDGKEFFGNNRNLVLQNIPAEIIDKVKAYERKSDMARITGIDDGNERTVLDLAVKKDRKKGFFGNADGSYGTHDRYSGRMNFNSFRGDQKLSFVGNGNNTNGNGLSDSQQLGTTMNWQNKKLELNGSVEGRFQQNGSASESNSQNFEMKNSAYSANRNSSASRSGNLNFQYKVEWKPDSSWNILFRPEFSYGRNSSSNRSESATWNDDPFLLSPTPLNDYKQLASRIGVNHRMGAGRNASHNINASASVQINKRFAKPGRNITLNLGGGYGDSDSESSNYSQTDYYLIKGYLGNDSTYHKVQYNRGPQFNYNFNARVSYSEPIAFQTFLQLSYNFRYNFRDNRRDVRSIFDPYNDQLGVNVDNYDLFYDRPEPYVVPDRKQCSYTNNIGQNHDIRLQVRFNRTKYQLTIGANLQPQVSRVQYEKGKIDTLLTRTVFNTSPVINFRYKFSRQEQLDLRYNAETGQPSITDMIPDTLSDANPLNIRIGNAGLKPSFTQNISFNYNKSIPDLQRSFAAGLQFHTTQNATTDRTEYDEVTGGRVSMPVNVNGNWNGSANFNFNTALDKAKHWRISTDTSTGISQAKGYQYQDKKTVERHTTNANFNQRLRLTFRRDWESGWQVEANTSGGFSYRLSRSNSTTATNLDSHNFNYGGSFVITTPWGMTISSDMQEQSRRGFSDAAMNTNQLIWGGTISQRFLPYKQLTISLRAVDILNQRDDINRSINATSRTDTRNEMVRSYVLLSANWRFGRFGGRGMGGMGGGRGMGGQGGMGGGRGMGGGGGRGR